MIYFHRQTLLPMVDLGVVTLHEDSLVVAVLVVVVVVMLQFVELKCVHFQI